MNIFIVGSARGIGLSIVEYFRLKGHHVYGFDRLDQHARDNFTPCWGNAYIDISSKIVPETIDALIFCAGSQPPIGPSMNIAPHDWWFGMRDNLFAAFNVIHTFFPAIRRHQNPRGKIICFSGGGATAPRPNLSAYACSKVAIVRLVETLAMEWAESGETIDINALAPGSVFTTMTQQILNMPEMAVGAEEKRKALATRNQDNAAALFDIHQCIEWLLSEKADGITGKLISAKWDEWRNPANGDLFREPDRFVLRRSL